jgi:hypothetical protein
MDFIVLSPSFFYNLFSARAVPKGRHTAAVIVVSVVSITGYA